MRRFILIASTLAGVLAAAGGILVGLALAALAILGREGQPDTLSALTVALALALVGLVFGLALARVGWRAAVGVEGHSFRLLRWGWLLLAWAGVLLTGQLVASAGFVPLMPVFHIAAGAVPAFLFLSVALAAAKGQGGSVAARPAVGSLAWGALGGTAGAIVLEVAIGLVAVGVILLLLAVVEPGFMERLSAWALEAQRTGTMPGFRGLEPLASSSVLAVGVLGFIGVVVPVIEELAKGLAVPLAALAGRRLTRLDGFLLGAAAGAGFAVLEGILNGALALRMPGTWWALMLVRGGTAAIHVLASALVGLGWQVALEHGAAGRGRRWVGAIGLGLAAIALHGAWNGAAGLQTLVALGALAGGSTAAMMAGVLALMLIGFMSLLWLASLAMLVAIPRKLARVEMLPTPLSERRGTEGFPGASLTEDHQEGS